MDPAYITEQNKIASAGAWIWLVEISMPGYTTLYYTNNNEAVQYPVGAVDERPYIARPITMDDVEVSVSGKFPEYQIRIGDVDVTGHLRTRVRSSGGYVGGSIRLMVVHSAHLGVDEPAIDETATILSCETTAELVTFTIGIPSLLSKRFPMDRYAPGFCRHRFGDAMCKYVGTLTTCNHTLAECTERNNSVNFGGSPGIVGGVYG